MIQRSGIIKDKSSNYYYVYSDKENKNIKISNFGNSCLKNIGGLAKISNTVVLCLTETKNAPFSKNGDLFDYFMVGSNSDQMAEGSSFTVVKESTFVNKNNEVYSVYSLKVDENISDKMKVEISTLSGYFAFHYDINEEMIIMINNDEFTGGLSYEYNHIYLFYCKDDICNMKYGFIIYNNNTVLQCETNNNYGKGNCNESNNSCKYNFDVGRVIIDKEGAKMCVILEDNSFIFKNINTSSNYVSSKSDSSDIYQLYVISGNGYIFNRFDKDGNFFVNEIDGESKILLSCKEYYNCYKNKPGYYLNYIDDKLIYCKFNENENENVCNEVDIPNNGYYINSFNKEVVKCRESTCELYDAPTSCSNNSYGVMKQPYNDYTYYCDGNNIINFLVTYFKVSKIDASSLYPNIVSGNNVIVLKMDTYSIVQYISENENEDNGTWDEQCTNQNSIMYICPNLNTGCNTKKNECDLSNPTNICKGYYLDGSNFYYCNGNKNCDNYSLKDEKPIGYFVTNDNKYVKCDGKACQTITLTTKSCTTSTIGEMMLKNSEAKLCVNSNVLVGFSDVNNFSNYILGNNENMFYDNESNQTLVSITNNSIRPISISELSKTYTYLINDKMYKLSLDDGSPELVEYESGGIFAFEDKESSNGGVFMKTIIDDDSISTYKFENTNIGIYDCDKNICYKTKGHILIANNIILRCDNGCSILNDNYCYYNEGHVCIQDSIFKIYIETLSEEYNSFDSGYWEIKKNEINYFFSYNYSYYNVYKSNKNGSIIAMIKTDRNYYKSVNKSENKRMIVCSDNGTNVNCKESTEEGFYFVSSSEEEKEVYFCEKENTNLQCNSSDKIDGYYINSYNKEIIKCSNSICELFTSTSSSCTINTNEVILLDNKLIYCNGIIKVDFLEYEQYVKLTSVSVASRYPIVKSGNDNILLKLDRYSVTQYVTEGDDICVKPDYTKDSSCEFSTAEKFTCPSLDESCDIKKNHCNINEPTRVCNGYYFVNTSTTDGYLYYCDGYKCDNLCSEGSEIPRGYFVVYSVNNEETSNPEYVKCDGSSCSLITKKISTSTCTSSYIGQLVSNNSEVKFCFKTNEIIKFSSIGSISNYILETKTKTIFSDKTNEPILLSITSNSIRPINISNYNEDNYKLVETEKRGIFAFEDLELTISPGIYIKSIINDFNNQNYNIGLYDCEKSNCYKTSGYIKLDNVILRCDESMYKCEEENKVLECNYKNVGKAFIDTDSSFNICINSSVNGNYFKQIIKSEINYIFSVVSVYKSNEFSLFKSNEFGDIIAIAKTDGNYYKSINNNENKQLIVCSNDGTDYKCKESTEQGYYLISNSSNSEIEKEFYFCQKGSNNVIQCNSYSSEKTDGYFINLYTKEIIKCSNSICELFTPTSSSCTINTNEVILLDNKLIYCNGISKVDFLEYEQYVKLTGVNVESRYPIIISGNDNILLKLDSYSVTQFVTGNDGICVKPNLAEDTECIDVSAEKFICPSLDEPCSTSKNHCNIKEPTSVCNGYYFEIKNTSTNVVDLHYCDGISCQNICSEDSNIPRGYFIAYNVNDEESSKPEYIQCNGSSCLLFTKKISTSSCTSSYIGQLVSNNSEIKLCVKANEMVNFSNNESISKYNYVFDIKTKTIFSDISSGQILLSITSNSMRSIDISNLNNKIYEISSENGNNKLSDYDSEIREIIAFKDYEIENSPENEDLLKCDNNKCVKDVNIEIECSNSYDSNVGKAYIKDSIFYICTKSSRYTNYKNQEIQDNKINYFFSMINNYKYNLYKSNSLGNIIAISMTDANYYPNSDTDVNYYPNNDTSSEKNIIVCKKTNSLGSICECEYIKKEGYYLIEISGSDILNYCTYNGDVTCEEKQTIEGGYFINSYNNDIIKCDNNSNCEIFTPGTACSDNTNEVIILKNQSFYCNGKEQISFSDTSKYILLSNIDINYIYPSISKGTSSILLKIDRYYVTQYITEEKEDLTKDSDCLNESAVRYKCPSLNESCIVEKNICNPLDPTNVCVGYFFINTDIKTKKGNMYYCYAVNDNENYCQPSNNNNGYFKAYIEENVEYIQCNENECIILELDLQKDNKCSKSTIGKLISNGSEAKLCINSNIMVGFSKDGIYSNYFLENDGTTIFSKNENDNLLISVTKNSMKLVSSLD
ncbi:hypothetical protein PIROE2DRAFT_20691, partial [Piromyces sp. E2]